MNDASRRGLNGILWEKLFFDIFYSWGGFYDNKKLYLTMS